MIYDAEAGIIWSSGPAPEDHDFAENADAAPENTVYTEFQHDGDLVQYAERGVWLGRLVLWRSNSGEQVGEWVVDPPPRPAPRPREVFPPVGAVERFFSRFLGVTQRYIIIHTIILSYYRDHRRVVMMRIFYGTNLQYV